MNNLEVGVVNVHPIVFMWRQIKGIFGTWMYARKTGQDCTKWYGVYVRNSEIVYAHCGAGESAKERADLIVKNINSDTVTVDTKLFNDIMFHVWSNYEKNKDPDSFDEFVNKIKESNPNYRYI